MSQPAAPILHSKRIGASLGAEVGGIDLAQPMDDGMFAAVDQALEAALCPFPEQPPVLKYRFNLTDNVRKNGVIGGLKRNRG